MATPYTKGSESINQAEHISPEKTGDNIDAKRTANYVWDGSEWVRKPYVQPITGTITAEASTLAEFQFNDSDNTTTASTEYFGYTKPDGTWLVKKLTDTALRYATVTNNGAVTTYADAWAAIASLTYGRMDEAF